MLFSFYNLVSLVIKTRSISNSPQDTVFNIKIIAPRNYGDEYEKTHESLGTDLQKITAEVENQLNNSVRFKTNKFSLKINLEHPSNHPIMDQLDESVCEGSVSSVTNVLNQVNLIDPSSHYILLLPCPPTNYTDIFKSINIDVPIIENRLNIQCTNRIAIFQENKFDKLMATFGNALIKAIGGSMDSYSKLNTTHTGDDGVKVSMTINEETIHEILNSRCFYNKMRFEVQ